MFKNKISPMIHNFSLKKIKSKLNFKKVFSKKPQISPTKINYRFFFMFPILCMPKMLVLKDDEDKNEKSEDSFTLEMKDIIRGEYENKIRTFASIEKRFLIFSKVKSGQDYRMTYFQFLDSLVPFQYIKTNPSEEVIKNLMENKSFLETMNKVDINGDGFINFEEYIILSVFLTVPLRDYIQHFPKGVITREELCEYLMNIITKIESLKFTEKKKIDGRLISTDYNTLYKYMLEFIKKAFPNNVKIDIKKDISNFKSEVYSLMLFYEFYRLPQSKENKISMEKFAKVLLSYTNIYKSKSILKKIDEKLINPEGEVTFDQFVSFFFFLTQFNNEKVEIFKKGKITFKDLRKLADEKLRNMQTGGIKIKKEISDKQLRLLIDLFDDNEDGALQFEEINDVLKRRTFYSNSISDFKSEKLDITKFIKRGINFIKDNLWFLR